MRVTLFPTKKNNHGWGWQMRGAESSGSSIVLDASDLQDQYYSDVFYEDAGNGLVRIIRYVKKKGILVPVVSTLSSAQSLVQFGEDISNFARAVLRGSASVH